jgi:hypothetical protein
MSVSVPQVAFDKVPQYPDVLEKNSTAFKKQQGYEGTDIRCN